MRARAQQSFFWIERGSRPIRAAQHAESIPCESDTSGVQTGHAATHWALLSRYMYTFAPNRVQCIDSDWELASLHCRRVAVAVVASRWELSWVVRHAPARARWQKQKLPVGKFTKLIYWWKRARARGRRARETRRAQPALHNVMSTRRATSRPHFCDATLAKQCFAPRAPSAVTEHCALRWHTSVRAGWRLISRPLLTASHGTSW